MSNPIAEQFADNWLLVAENDYNTYTELMSEAGSLSTVELSDKLRSEWEELAEQVTELVEENISAVAGLFISQMLQGYGSTPFDLIARRVMEAKEETK